MTYKTITDDTENSMAYDFHVTAKVVDDTLEQESFTDSYQVRPMNYLAMEPDEVVYQMEYEEGTIVLRGLVRNASENDLKELLDTDYQLEEIADTDWDSVLVYCQSTYVRENPRVKTRRVNDELTLVQLTLDIRSEGEETEYDPT